MILPFGELFLKTRVPPCLPAEVDDGCCCCCWALSPFPSPPPPLPPPRSLRSASEVMTPESSNLKFSRFFFTFSFKYRKGIERSSPLFFAFDKKDQKYKLGFIKWVIYIHTFYHYYRTSWADRDEQKICKSWFCVCVCKRKEMRRSNGSISASEHSVAHATRTP